MIIVGICFAISIMVRINYIKCAFNSMIFMEMIFFAFLVCCNTYGWQRTTWFWIIWIYDKGRINSSAYPGTYHRGTIKKGYEVKGNGSVIHYSSKNIKWFWKSQEIFRSIFFVMLWASIEAASIIGRRRSAIRLQEQGHWLKISSYFRNTI